MLNSERRELPSHKTLPMRNLRNWIIFFSCILCNFAFLQGQSSYLFKQLEVSNGLSHNQVNHIFRDSKGFMWFSTASGLNRYDGYKFKVYFHNPKDPHSLPDNWVSNVQEDNNGHLWIHTAGGYTVFDTDSETFEESHLLLNSMNITGQVDLLYLDENKNIWCYVNAEGFYRYHTDSGESTFFPQNGETGQLNLGMISDLKETENHYLFVFQSGLLQLMDKTTLQVTAFESPVEIHQDGGNHQYRAFVDSDNDIWLYSDIPVGTWYFSAEQKEWFHIGAKNSDLPVLLSSDMLQDIAQDPSGLIWMATDHGGIDIIDKRTMERKNLRNHPYDNRTIAHNSINCIYTDDADMIWIGTYKNGISYYNESIYKFGVEHLRALNKVDNFKPDINSIIKDDYDNIWIGSNGSGLVQLQTKKGAFKIYNHNPLATSSLTNDVVVSLCAGKDGKLWIGTYLGGMDCFDGAKFTHYRHDPQNPNSLANDNVWSIVEDPSGMIWIGTLGSGLQKFDPVKKQFTTFNHSTRHQLSSDYISSLFLGRNDQLILGTAIGITLFNTKTADIEVLQTNRKGDQTFTNLNVNHVYEDSRGLVWIGTRNGLNIWDPKQDKIIQIYKSDGLSDNVIAGIIEDNSRNMWITTANGVSNIMVKLNATDHDYNYSFVNYSEMDGLQSNEFNLRSIFKSRHGELLLGGTKGFNLFNPESIRYNTEKPNVHFTGLRLFNEEVIVGKEYNGNKILSSELNKVDEVSFKYRQNVFSVEFSAMNYVLPEKTTFAYMLEGFNTDWLVTDDGVHSVTYTNLTPGKYILRVKAANSDGYWSETSTALHIRIRPPFWLSPFAYIVYAVILMLTLFLARAVIIRNEQQKFKMTKIELEAQRKHEVDDMKLRFFTNVSHELRTPLTLIISPLENLMKSADDNQKRVQLSLIHKNAIRLLNMVNQLLDFRKSDVNKHSLNLSYGDIVSFLRNSCDQFLEYAEKKNIHLTFFSSVETLSMVFDEDKMAKIVMNLLSNAIKFTEKNGSVEMMIKLLPKNGEDENEKEQLEIRIIDSGIGIKDDEKKRIFERFYQGKIKNEDFPGSGIGLHIVKEFVALCNGSIQVYDNAPKGSLFVLLFPIDRLKHIVNQSISETDETGVNESEPIPITYDDEGNEIPMESETRILVVDDNDDFRRFMRDVLKKDFTITEASNGKEAWEKMLDNLPDIIISDVMMPEMNGYELCEMIKNDVRTSHIPIILLTAHSAQEQELRGLESGADDYITKPFNLDILCLRINNIVESRSHRQKRFKHQIDIAPSEITITPLDEKLIQNAIKLVEDNIGDSDFSVEKLSKELGISRVHLYKKMVSITGKSPIEFIRIIRLKRAAQLLSESQLQIAEIAYLVGFNNPKNFSKYFKEEFDILPSQYQSNPTILHFESTDHTK